MGCVTGWLGRIRMMEGGAPPHRLLLSFRKREVYGAAHHFFIPLWGDSGRSETKGCGMPVRVQSVPGMKPAAQAGN